MACVKVTAKLTDPEPSAEEVRVLSDNEEDLSNVEARSLLLLWCSVSLGLLKLWSRVMSKRGILVLGFAVHPKMKKHQILERGKEWCFGISLLLGCVCHLIPLFRRFCLVLVFSFTT